MLPIHKLKFQRGIGNLERDFLNLDKKIYSGVIYRFPCNFINRELRLHRFNADCISKIRFRIPYQSFDFYINDKYTTIMTDSFGEYVFPDFIILFLSVYSYLKIRVQNDVQSVNIDYIYLPDEIKIKYSDKSKTYFGSSYFHPTNIYKTIYTNGDLCQCHFRDEYNDIQNMVQTNKINAKLLYKILIIDKSFEPTNENLPNRFINMDTDNSKHKLYHLLDKIVNKSPDKFIQMLSFIFIKDIGRIVTSYLDIMDILPDVYRMSVMKKLSCQTIYSSRFYKIYIYK